jgi:hypothetical protein
MLRARSITSNIDAITKQRCGPVEFNIYTGKIFLNGEN